MLFPLRLLAAAVLLLMIPTPVIGQKISNAVPGFEQYFKQWGLDRGSVLPFLDSKPRIEGPLPLPPVPPSTVPHTHDEPEEKEEKRFSHWGYRHAELHKKKLVAKLQELTDSKCCDGPKSGECRVSSVNIPAGLVLVDGFWFPYDTKKTKVVVMEELEGFRDGQESIALVCAGRTYEMTGWEGPPKRTTPTTYCIAVSPPKT